MHGLLRLTLCALLLCPCSVALAATVQRCEDANGHLTFTLQGCPGEQHTQLQQADNPTPGSGKAVPLAKPSKHKRSPRKSKTASRLVVVGEHQDGCGNRLSSSERRSAIIGQRVRAGMTQRDVESALGKPDKISSQNGQTRYQYRDEKGHSRQVSFDESGCVRTKR